VELPTCGNFLSHTCARSDVFVSKETDTVFVITCRTCKGVNVWPKDPAEKAARYQAYLKKMYDLETKDIEARKTRAFSILGGK
jgi:hypothetical protein